MQDILFSTYKDFLQANSNNEKQCSVVHGGKMLRAHAGVARSPVFKTQIQVRPK